MNSLIQDWLNYFSSLLSLNKIENQNNNDTGLKIINENMHCRNLYRYKRPNYHQLSLKYNYFQPFVQLNNKTEEYFVDYKNSAACYALTKVLLENDFNLLFEMPNNHLCPAVTQRLNYILWLQDLLHCINVDHKQNQIENKTKCFGYDIGTGASCIFPLLGYKIGQLYNEEWHFIASEIDDESIQSANYNIIMNHLDSFIQVVKQECNDYIFKNIINNINNGNKEKIYDFTVCNPPFFENIDETSNNKFRANPATQHELIYTKQKTNNTNINVDNNNDNNDSYENENENNEVNGEIAFIRNMIDEIVELDYFYKFKWFTSMIGKKSTLKPLIHYIETISIKHKKYDTLFILQTEFMQGKQTRWGIAFSFYQDMKNNYYKMKKKNEILNQKINDHCIQFDGINNDDHIENNNHIKNKYEFVVDYNFNNNNINNPRLSEIVEKYVKQYGLQPTKSTENMMEINNVEINGFECTILWMISTTQKHIIVSILFKKGEKSLLDGFVQWLKQKNGKDI